MRWLYVQPNTRAYACQSRQQNVRHVLPFFCYRPTHINKRIDRVTVLSHCQQSGALQTNQLFSQVSFDARKRTSDATIQYSSVFKHCTSRTTTLSNFTIIVSRTWQYALTIIVVTALSKDSTNYCYQSLHTCTKSLACTDTRKSRKMNTITYSILVVGVRETVKRLQYSQCYHL